MVAVSSAESLGIYRRAKDNGRIAAGWLARFCGKVPGSKARSRGGVGWSMRRMMLGIDKKPASHAASGTAAARRRVQARLRLWAKACHRKMVFTLAVPRTVS